MLFNILAQIHDMGKKVIITGASGMIGKGVLLECLEDSRIEKVLILSRRPLEMEHEKLEEIVHKDFYNFSSYFDLFKKYDACFYCSGTSSVGKKEKEYNEITYKMTLHLAKLLSEANPKVCFVYVSGKGSDSSEKGRSMWARIKGKTENKIFSLSFNSAFMMRPGFILPLKGVRSGNSWYRFIYGVLSPINPLLLAMFPQAILTTERLGQAMIECSFVEGRKEIMEAKDIKAFNESVIRDSAIA